MPRGCRIQIKGKETNHACLQSPSRREARIWESWVPCQRFQGSRWDSDTVTLLGPSHSSPQTPLPFTSWECSHLQIPGSKFRPSNCGGSTGVSPTPTLGKGALTVPTPKQSSGGRGEGRKSTRFLQCQQHQHPQESVVLLSALKG